MDIRRAFEENILETSKYRCCPQNCHYFEFCVLQDGIKNASCREIIKACEEYERTTGIWIDTLEKFQRAYEEKRKRELEAIKVEVVPKKKKLRCKMIYHHVCIHCGKEFENVKPVQKYCCVECMREDRRKGPIKRTCALCGKEFYQKTKLFRVQKFCSQRCSGRYGNMKKYEKKH